LNKPTAKGIDSLQVWCGQPHSLDSRCWMPDIFLSNYQL